MSNPNTPTGFAPFRRLDGGAGTGQVNTYRIQSAYNTPIGQGDPVKVVAGYINRAGATDTIRGIFMQANWTDTSGLPQVNKKWTKGTATLGSQDATCLICDDVNSSFVVRLGGAANNPTQADASKSFASGNLGNYTADGRSQAFLDYTTANSSTANQQWVALRFIEQPVGSSTSPGNDPTAPYALMEVRMGIDDFKNSTGS